MWILLLACCLTFSEIEANYYGAKSLEVASIDVTSLDFPGDSLNIALNRIARANYKHQRYERAYDISFMIDTTGYDRLRWNTVSLRALLAKNTHRFMQADSLFREGIEDAKSYPHTMYELHLNYAELKRLQSDFQGRETQLLLAMAFAEGWQKDKVIRVLARHYFNIMLDFTAAEEMMEYHSRFDKLSPEGKVGFRLLQAQYQQALRNHTKAQEYYVKANQLAKQAGFVGFQREAADGIMRSIMMVDRQNKRQREMYIFNAILLVIIVGFGIWNFRLEHKINGHES